MSYHPPLSPDQAQHQHYVSRHLEEQPHGRRDSVLHILRHSTKYSALLPDLQ
ncbi:rCG55593, partial [Rattus norvegicus]